MLDKLSKYSEYAERTPKYYGRYDWIKLRNKLHDIAKTEKNEETNFSFHFLVLLPSLV